MRKYIFDKKMGRVRREEFMQEEYQALGHILHTR